MVPCRASKCLKETKCANTTPANVQIWKNTLTAKCANVATANIVQNFKNNKNRDIAVCFRLSFIGIHHVYTNASNIQLYTYVRADTHTHTHTHTPRARERAHIVRYYTPAKRNLKGVRNQHVVGRSVTNLSSWTTSSVFEQFSWNLAQVFDLGCTCARLIFDSVRKCVAMVTA